MFPFLARLIEFLIVLSVVRSVIGFVGRFMSGMRPPAGPRAQSGGSAPKPAQAATMLQQDPVCGTYVAIDASLKRIVNGKVVHFCSAECRDRYSV